MVDWLYGRDLNLDATAGPAWRHVLNCYKLADKCLMYDYKNILVDALRQWVRTNGVSSYVGVSILVLARRWKLETNALYRFVLQSFVWGMRNQKVAYSSTGPSQEGLLKALDHLDIARDITLELAYGSGVNPTTLTGCQFHDHSDGSTCGWGRESA